MRRLLFFLFGLAAFPWIVLAAPRDFKGFVEIIFNLLNSVIPILLSLALLAFFWGVGQFILYSDNEEKRAEGKQILVWGIIGQTFGLFYPNFRPEEIPMAPF